MMKMMYTIPSLSAILSFFRAISRPTGSPIAYASTMAIRPMIKEVPIMEGWLRFTS